MSRSKPDVYYLDLNPFVTYPSWFNLLSPKIKKDTKWKGVFVKSLIYDKVNLNTLDWYGIYVKRSREYNEVVLTYSALYPLLFEIVYEKMSQFGVRVQKGKRGI